MRITLTLFVFFYLSSCAQRTVSTVAVAEPDRPLAFPSAEGYGKFATGGREGEVYIVTNLNDDGPGSLREAIKKHGPRIITFAVSGTIALKSELVINNDSITIAGQTAPGDGICVRNHQVRISANNVIIRYMRFRLGDEAEVQGDAFSGSRIRDVMIDHCSISWATDECASFYYNEKFTMQWCIISESLNSSVHEKGDHGYGGIWGGRGVTFHHNLLAHHNSRLPRFSGSFSVPNNPDELVDFRNNVVYNWMQNNTYGGEKGRYNIINNYYKPGPATHPKRRDRIVNPSEPYGRFYISGNVLDGNREITEDNSKGIAADSINTLQVAVPFAVEDIYMEVAARAYDHVLEDAGAGLIRDEIDLRIVEEVRSGTAGKGKRGDGIIDSQREVGGWPELKSIPVPKDTDHDGMPDAWEISQKLNPNDSRDASRYTLSKSYTNIEVHINGLTRK